MTKDSVSAILSELRSTVNKAYGEEVIRTANKFELEKLKTGIFSIDAETGGIPRGRMMILVGDESTCKSTLLYTIAGKFQRICGGCMKGRIKEVNFTKVKVCYVKGDESKLYLCDTKRRNLYCPGEEVIDNLQSAYSYELECSYCSSPQYSIFVLIDSEQNYTKAWASKFGVVNHFTVIGDAQYSEQVGDVVREALNTGRASFVGIDSLDAQGPKVEDEASFEDQQMGVQARVWNKIIRILHSKLNKKFLYSFKKDKKDVEESRTSESTVCIVQQWREKIGAYGDPRTMGGGRGGKYASSLTIATSVGEKVFRGSDKDKIVRGLYFNFELRKQKTGIPYRKGRFFFNVEKREIENVATILDYGVRYDVVEQSGSWYSYGKIRLGQGEEKSCLKLLDDPKLLKEIEKKILTAIRKERNE